MEYYVKLFELFVKATGRKFNKDNYRNDYRKYRKEFIDWLTLYKTITLEYKVYLTQYLGIELNGFNIAELGKGNIDSIVEEDALLITQYGYTFSDAYHENSNLIIDENDIYLDFDGDKEKLVGINTYITQNPYLYTSVMSDLKKLHNIHKKNIIVGVYGNKDDKDYQAKIKMLKQFKKSLDDLTQEYILDYATKDNNYFCSITRK